MVSNPNVIKLHDIIEKDNSCFIITELISGGTLDDYIKSKVFLSE